MKRAYRFVLMAQLAVLWSAQVTAQVEPQSKPPADCAELAAVKERLGWAEARLKDWAELARYREANARLAPPPKSEMRVAFMGDSITDIWVQPEFGGFFPGKPYIDRGISGQTAPQMLVRFRQDVIALRPKAVVILAGTNDIAGNTGPTTLEAIEDNLESMAELARAHGIRVILASLLPVSDYSRDHDGQPIIQTTRRPPEQILALNDWLKRYAEQRGLVYLDYFSAMVDAQGFLKKDLSDDGLHPNAAGYAVMAPLAERAIQTALAPKRASANKQPR